MDDCREGSCSSSDEDEPVPTPAPGPSHPAVELLSEMTISPSPGAQNLESLSSDMLDVQVRLAGLETKVDSLIEMIRSVKSTLNTLTLSTKASSDFHISDWNKRAGHDRFK